LGLGRQEVDGLVFERFTDAARRVVVLAQEEARMHNHNYVATEHLLLGLLSVGECEAANVMESLGIIPAAVRQAVEEIIGQGQQAPSGHIPFTPQAKKALELSSREALRLGDDYVGTEHLLLGMVREGEGVAAQVLVRFGADINSIDRLLTRSKGAIPKASFVDMAYRRGSALRGAERTPGDANRTSLFERFTDRARRVVVLAQDESRRLNHNYIGTEHILLGLIHEGEGVAANALVSLGIVLESARQQVEELIGRGQQTPSRHIPFTPRAKKVLELSLREAMQRGHNYIDTEHILLGLIREGEGVGAQALLRLGAAPDRVRTKILTLLRPTMP